MSGYIGPIPVPQGIQNKETFTATAGQTTFNTNGYTDGAFISVYLNGVRLVNGTDYTATNGSDVVLASGANASDVLDFETFNEFSLASQQFENITTKNPTHEDTDGGRESAITFKGEQSGGEISTLAQIQASHDGTADDQKGDLIFKTNDGSDNDAPTEAMRIDSAQTVGIGTAAPSPTGLAIQTGGGSKGVMLARNASGSSPTNGQGFGSFGFKGIMDGTNSMAAAEAAIEAIASENHSGSTAGTDLAFYTKPAGTGPGSSPTERWRITKDGHFKAASNGLGIDFSATEGSNASSAILDDYEEGTWTPVLKATTTDPTVGGYHANTGGRYTKIGNRVYVNFFMQTTSITANGSGTLQIGGLPYTNIVLPGASEGSGMFVNYYVNTNLAAGRVLQGYVRNGQTTMLLIENGKGDDSGAYASGTPAGDFGLYAMAFYHID